MLEKYGECIDAIPEMNSQYKQCNFGEDQAKQFDNMGADSEMSLEHEQESINL